VLYEVGIFFSGSEVKNAADVIVKTPLHLFGRNWALVFNLLVGVGVVLSLLYAGNGRGVYFGMFLPMFLESLLYALLMGPAINFLLQDVLSVPLAIPFYTEKVLQTILAIGAGVYEEILYRLLLLSVLYYILHKALKFKEWFSSLAAIVLGAAVFSAVHHIGPMSETFRGDTFLFRFVAGIILSTIFILRGLGIAVYTHAIYDVILVIRGPL